MSNSQDHWLLRWHDCNAASYYPINTCICHIARVLRATFNLANTQYAIIRVLWITSLYHNMNFISESHFRPQKICRSVATYAIVFLCDVWYCELTTHPCLSLSVVLVSCIQIYNYRVIVYVWLDSDSSYWFINHILKNLSFLYIYFHLSNNLSVDWVISMFLFP